MLSTRGKTSVLPTADIPIGPLSAISLWKAGFGRSAKTDSVLLWLRFALPGLPIGLLPTDPKSITFLPFPVGENKVPASDSFNFIYSKALFSSEFCLLTLISVKLLTFLTFSSFLSSDSSLLEMASIS